MRGSFRSLGRLNHGEVHYTNHQVRQKALTSSHNKGCSVTLCTVVAPGEPDSCVKGHQGRGTGGHEQCPLVAWIQVANSSAHQVFGGVGHARRKRWFIGVTPCPARGCVRRTDSQEVWQTWA